MKRSAIISLIIVFLFGGCLGQGGYRLRSPDEMVRRRLSQMPEAPKQKDKRVGTPPVEQPQLPFEVYTWQPRNREDGTKEIVILGKNLTNATSLTIGDVVVKLRSIEGGRSAIGRYPFEAPKDMPILITVGEHQVELSERFSPLKLEGLPRILSCKFLWETVEAPERIPEVGGRSVKAIRFDCIIEGFRGTNAPVTAFIGSVVIPNDQINEGGSRFTGYVYLTSRLEEGAPLTIDFGHGLRVLAPVPFKLP